MLKAANEIEKAQWENAKKEDKNALMVMAKNGMKINEASPELKVELKKIADEMLNKYLKDANSNIKSIFNKYSK